MKVVVTLTDEICPGSDRVTSRLPDGQVMRFNRVAINSEGDPEPELTWSGEIHEIIARDLTFDGFDVTEIGATPKKKGGKK